MNRLYCIEANRICMVGFGIGELPFKWGKSSKERIICIAFASYRIVLHCVLGVFGVCMCVYCFYFISFYILGVWERARAREMGLGLNGVVVCRADLGLGV